MKLRRILLSAAGVLAACILGAFAAAADTTTATSGAGSFTVEQV